MDDDAMPISPPSLRAKLKNSLCFSCCFSRRHRHHHQVPNSPPLPPQQASAAPSDDKPTLIWSSVPSGGHDGLKDDIKDKCMTIFNRMGNGISKHRRHPSTEFRYDPLSYSLNFEDGFDCDDEAPLRNFSSRLPPSPPVKAAREITAIS